MIDPKPSGNEATSPKKTTGHRAVDVKDAVAEMTERAKEISQEAGTAMAAAMKDLIAAAAGLAGFAIESARDLVQFMVRRGQMTQDEADKLMKDVEAAQPKKKAAAAASPVKGNTAAPRNHTAVAVKTPTAPAKPAAKGSAETRKTESKTAKAAKSAPKKAPAPAASKKSNTSPKAKKAPAAKK